MRMHEPRSSKGKAATNEGSIAPWMIQDISPHDFTIDISRAFCELEEVDAPVEPNGPYSTGTI